MFFFDLFFLLMGLLLSVAFFTLMERKILGYVHFRKGPAKLFYFGIFQPISDAVKLFCKESLKSSKMVYYFYISGPLFGLSLMLALWMSFPSFFSITSSNFSVLFIFSLLSLGIYFLLFCCWGSLSKYAMLGGYRAISQTISYEVSMIFFILALAYILQLYDIKQVFFIQSNFWFLFLSTMNFTAWLFICLSETNRTPFDFSESESELVSGFNTEYGGGIFSLIFISEYGMILFLSSLTIIFFMGSSDFLTKLILLCFLFVWIRCCYPRYRYDFLMYSAWKQILPFSLSVLLLVSVIF